MKKEKDIQSALIMCYPNLRGFFYSRFLGFFLNKFLNILISKKKTSVLGIIHSSLGKSALIVLPYSTLEMKNSSLKDREKLVLKGLKLAVSLGVKKISFAGILPSLLNHFQNLSLKDWKDYEGKILTSQTMTCVGMAVIFEELLKKTECKVLSIVGMGAIGSSCLTLLLEKVLTPKKIILCDTSKKREQLKKQVKEIEKKYSIPVENVFYGEESFSKIYEGDMFVGAVSSKNILNPNLLKAGSILVDDSFPPILSVRKAICRMKNEKDVLILSGGKMEASYYRMSSLRFIPQLIISILIKQLGARGLPGCWLEALVYAKIDKEEESRFNPYSLGKNDQTKLMSAWDLKKSLGLTLPKFHFFAYQTPSHLLENVFIIRQKKGLSKIEAKNKLF